MILILLNIFQEGVERSGLCAVEPDLFLLKERYSIADTFLNILNTFRILNLKISGTISTSLKMENK